MKLAFVRKQRNLQGAYAHMHQKSKIKFILDLETVSGPLQRSWVVAPDS